MSALNQATILDALKRVPGPDGRNDIVALGMVSGIVIKDGNIGFAIEVDPNHAAQLKPLRRAAEQAVNALPGVLSVTAVLTAHRGGPAPSAPQTQHAHAGHSHGGAQPGPGAATGQKAAVPGVRHIVAVASG